ncbi:MULTISPECIES: adaptor protein MecA [Anoxybacillus]|uniref:Adapter protein MecA n=1 Tax=Anoxybacillus flavithermus AK1 TaxID=1297581 RepID=M8DQE9_9BACL|nr:MULTISPECIES: adaptor protein MecA [Anoxybacillus]EMT46660.1 adaptor protein [Anoxybacillus flavithermus AK1]KHF30523.1 Adapter protein MecA 1 [Anoxybacillus sp. BCO1]MBW7650598.1 adaptor protein MecA [Anoxybacillus sp. ST4]
MEIERINEYTLKLYISYGDIEERGFDREEIWFNRERSEELFWEMMDEIHQEVELYLEGPLWIQVHAVEKGIEVFVTKAQISKDGTKLELPILDERFKDLPVDEKIEQILDQHFNMIKAASTAPENPLQFVIRFKTIEDVISLAHRRDFSTLNNRLFALENKYYLYVEFTEDDHDHDIDNMLSILLEYGQDSQMTIHRLEEYGKTIIAEQALTMIAKHFPN